MANNHIIRTHLERDKPAIYKSLDDYAPRIYRRKRKPTRAQRFLTGCRPLFKSLPLVILGTSVGLAVFKDQLPPRVQHLAKLDQSWTISLPDPPEAIGLERWKGVLTQWRPDDHAGGSGRYSERERVFSAADVPVIPDLIGGNGRVVTYRPQELLISPELQDGLTVPYRAMDSINGEVDNFDPEYGHKYSAMQFL